MRAQMRCAGGMQSRNASVFEGCDWEASEHYSGSEQPCWVEASAYARLAAGGAQPRVDPWLSWLMDPATHESVPVVACLTPKGIWMAGADPTQHPYRWLFSGVAAAALAACLLCCAFRRSCRPWLAVTCAPSAGSLRLDRPSSSAKDAVWNVNRVTDHLRRWPVRECLEEMSLSGSKRTQAVLPDASIIRHLIGPF